MQIKPSILLLSLLCAGFYSCENKKVAKTKAASVYKGLYSFGPEIKSFKQCNTGDEFWVTDSCAQLELKYSQFNAEHPDEPVYIEVKGYKLKSPKNGLGSDYDSVLIVKKLIKITKDIPKGMCN